MIDQNVLKNRKILFISLLKEDTPSIIKFRFRNIDFEVIQHPIGWRPDLARSLIRNYDGFADGIILEGMKKNLVYGSVNKIESTTALTDEAKFSRIYFGDAVSQLFTDWTLKRWQENESRSTRSKRGVGLKGKHVFFHTALSSRSVGFFIANQAEIMAFDLALFLKIPKIIRDVRQLGVLSKVKSLPRFLARKHLVNIQPTLFLKNDRIRKLHHKTLAKADIIVSFGHLLDAVMNSFNEFGADGGPNDLTGKTIVTDYASDSFRLFAKKNSIHLIECVPRMPFLELFTDRPFALVHAIIDQVRLSESPNVDFDDFLIQFLDEEKTVPNVKLDVGESNGGPAGIRTCAFFIHALSNKDLWRPKELKFMRKAPKKIKTIGEKVMSHVPVFHYGTITGIKSVATGIESKVEVYALTATPGELRAMKDKRLKTQLHRALADAESKGARLAGLGAYLKVVGDAGVSLNQESRIPITTGNSYSAATTIWAAEEMVQRLGFVKGKPKVVVIGATGAIGRVSALVLSKKCDEMAIVGVRADRLLDVKEEIRVLSPHCNVSISVRADQVIGDADMIVTATSNLRGQILDINLVKSGAVICDCSRPLDISKAEAVLRPDVLVIQSGEIELPGDVKMNVDIGLPKPAVYACLAETALLSLEGRYEPYSIGRDLSHERVEEIRLIGQKHGARLSAISTHFGFVNDSVIENIQDEVRKRQRQSSFADRD